MGFREAIEQSGWDTARQQDAGRLCAGLRQALRRTDYTPDDQIYKNLDCDALIPDAHRPRHPTSRLALLDELLAKRPGSPDDLKKAASDFCHDHKREGPEDKLAPAHVLGRIWSANDLLDLLLSQMGEIGHTATNEHLRKIIERASLGDQQEALADLWLGKELRPMWSFYDPESPGNPLTRLSGTRATTIDRLGLGEYHYERPTEELVQWGHRLPDGKKAMTPTAWDGGVKCPYWRPGGRTHPLGATGRFGDGDGLPEVVHAAVTGGALAVRISFVAG
ncbi:MAG: hypothetical protein FJ290_15390 [Planctomycetes bacterium]|nr:hypothetical protein [Planctomycetota bacterium]